MSAYPPYDFRTLLPNPSSATLALAREHISELCSSWEYLKSQRRITKEIYNMFSDAIYTAIVNRRYHFFVLKTLPDDFADVVHKACIYCWNNFIFMEGNGEIVIVEDGNRVSYTRDEKKIDPHFMKILTLTPEQKTDLLNTNKHIRSRTVDECYLFLRN